jgi:hypothetical protein
VKAKLDERDVAETYVDRDAPLGASRVKIRKSVVPPETETVHRRNETRARREDARDADAFSGGRVYAPILYAPVREHGL